MRSPVQDEQCYTMYDNTVCCCNDGTFDGTQQCLNVTTGESFNCGNNRYCDTGCDNGGVCTAAPPNPPACG